MESWNNDELSVSNRGGLALMRILFLFLAVIGGWAAEFERINPEAERHYAEKSFAQARGLYDAMDVSKLEAEQKRWVEFRRADTLWRSVETEADQDVGK